MSFNITKLQTKSKYGSEKITFNMDFADFCGILREKRNPNKAMFMYF